MQYELLQVLQSPRLLVRQFLSAVPAVVLVPVLALLFAAPAVVLVPVLALAAPRLHACSSPSRRLSSSHHNICTDHFHRPEDVESMALVSEESMKQYLPKDKKRSQ